MADPSPAEPEVELHAPDTDAPEHDRSPDVAASPSEADKGETKETLLEAVLRAVEPKEEGEEKDRAGTSPTSDAPAEPKEGDDKGDPTEEQLQVQPGDSTAVQKRIRKLLNQRNAFRAEAEVTQTLRNFLVTNDIAREDFQLTLDLAAAMRRGDFAAFLQGVGPYVQLATQALGITLPDDLQHQVSQGKVSFDVAAQMSRDRYGRALAEQRASRSDQVMSSQHAAAHQNALSQSIERTVASWEQGIRAADPDYGRKEETVRNFLWAVVQEKGAPTSPEHAVEIAKEAYARANRTVSSFSTQRQATRAVPSSTANRAASGARPEPRSMLEAAELGLARARGA